MKRSFVFLSILLATNLVQAQCIDESTPQTGMIGTVGETGSDFYGQSFFANTDTIVEVGVWLQESTSQGEVKIAIAPDDGLGNPMATAALWESVLLNPTFVGQWFMVSGLNIPVNVGIKYWVVIDGANAGATGNSSAGLSTDYTDTGENFKYSNDSGASWTTFTAPLAIYVGCSPATDDVGIIAIDTPITGCALGASEIVTVRVKNSGLSAQDTIPVYYRVNGGSPVSDTIFTTINPGDTLSFTFTTTVDLSVIGAYIFDAWTSLVADTSSYNDSVINYLVNKGSVMGTFPYSENFEGNALCGNTVFACVADGSCSLTGNWSNASGDDIDWSVDEGGTPSGNTGPLVDNTVGDATGNYLFTEGSGCNSKEAILLSPCLDFGILSNPAISFFYHMFGVNMGNLYVEVYSGGIWNTVDSIIGQQQSLQTDPWIKVSVDLSSFSGIVRVRLRAVTGGGYQTDMAIDDIIIYDQPLIDVGVISFDAPITGFMLSSTESVTVKVKNFGIITQDTIPVSYRVDGGTTITDTIIATIISGDTISYTFTTTVDLSVLGNYVFEAWTNLPGDTVMKNDSVSNYQVLNDSNITIGTGTNTNTNTTWPAPYGNWYTCSKHQMIIRASELINVGISLPGFIYSLGFNVQTANGTPLQSFTIKLKNTTDSVVTGAFDNSGLTTVWGPQTYAETNGWNTHVFSGSFYWDGTSNLLVETCFCNGTNNWTNSAVMYNSPTGFLSTIYSFSDADANHCTNGAGITSIADRPDMQMYYEPDTFPPVANFTIDTNVNCVGGNTQFTDISGYFPTAWLWDFGDSTGDTVQNPLHAYTDTGMFTVTLIAYNANGSDTVVMSNLMEIQKGPDLAVCNPAVASTSNDIGIYDVTFNTLNNVTGNAIEGYSDYSCFFSTTVNSGSKQTLSIRTGPVWMENVRAWIDYNNDGIFNDTTELVLTSNNTMQYHSIEFIIPQNVVFNTMLRMRIASDYASTSPPGSCDTLLYGQIEDYGVKIVPSTVPPVADFTIDIIDHCAWIVDFDDYSEYFPDGWLWDFGDGSSDSGSAQVTHTYPGPGTYNITLTASNSFGMSTIVKTFFIDSVVAEFSVASNPVEVGDNIQFLNTSTGANTYTWDFGNLNFSSEENPTYTYTSFGVYAVWLYATNSITGCVNSTSLILIVDPVDTTSSISETGHTDMVTITPNPSSGRFFITYHYSKPSEVNVRIYNMLGEVIYEEKLVVYNNFRQTIDLNEFSKGSYFINIDEIGAGKKDGDYQIFRKIIID